ncbi:MAG: hypothetical protein E4H20_05600 [Spirochaetales bacterium]|nr:MAG: hypothetical protein E4H20_05600 [Spirochaetales bacterium]
MVGEIAKLMDSGLVFVAYGAARASGDPRAAAFKERMYGDERVRGIVDELRGWPGPSLNSHKSARQFFHKLAFLADIGMAIDDPGVQTVIEAAIEHRDDNGIPLLPMNIGKGYGGTGETTWAWALCDAPTTLYALITLGYRDAGIDRAVDYLCTRRMGDCWGCVVSDALGTWRGPGKKGDPCPYATLIMLKLLLAYDADRYRDIIVAGARRLLDLWKNSQSEHPYIFYMGTDFRKLKLPFIWYDVLHLVEILSQVPAVRDDASFLEMVRVILDKERPDGGFIPESVYQEWKSWDFGQKKARSDWLELRVALIRARMADGARA